METEPTGGAGTGTSRQAPGGGPEAHAGAPADAGRAGRGAPAAGRAKAPSPKRRLLFLALGVVLAAALAVGLFGTRGGGHHPGGPPTAGDSSPTFSLARLGGGAPVGVPLDGGGHGHPAVVVFFASWCTPCQHEMPALSHLYAHERATGSPLGRVAMIGVDGSDPQSAALSFVQHSGVTFPVGRDPTYRVTQGEFGFAGLPETVFVRADGTIAGIHYGALSARALQHWQHQLLATA